MWSILKGLGLALALSACAANPNHLNSVYLDRFAAPNPTPAEFTVCHGFGCTEKSPAALSSEQWRRVAAVFKPRAKNAPAERQQIAHGVAMIQTMVGPQTGTDARQWTHRDRLVMPNFGDRSQLDCVDEAVNTWTYMTMMERAGLLHFHRVARLSNAGSLTDPFMRNTAVVQEINGGYFAVDASLVDGGVPPPVLPLTTWLAEWPPKLAAGAGAARAEETRPGHRAKAD